MTQLGSRLEMCDKMIQFVTLLYQIYDTFRIVSSRNWLSLYYQSINSSEFLSIY